MMKLKRITHEQKLSGRLYDELERLILRGQLNAGDRLPTESELCDQLGVSRSSLREALQQLKGRGVIESTAGRGMFVRSIDQSMMEKELQLFAQVEQDPDAFFELVEFRLMIEPEMARAAAKEITPELGAELDQLLAEMKANTGNLSAFMEADLDMHLSIAKKAGNRFVNMVLCCMKPLSKRFGHFNHGETTFARETLKEHTKLVRAIQSGDSRAAHKCMRNHLLSSRNHFRNRIAGS